MFYQNKITKTNPEDYKRFSLEYFIDKMIDLKYTEKEIVNLILKLYDALNIELIATIFVKKDKIQLF